ncbi:MAG: CHAT domain-containing protein, partial [Phormidium sp.]
MTRRWVGSLLTVSLLLGMGSLAPRVEAETVLVQGRLSDTFPLWTIPLLLGVLGIGATIKQHRKLGGTLIAAALVSAFVSPRLTPSYRVLAFANPRPEDPFNLPGTEAEVDALLELAPDSEIYRQDAATLEQFKRQSSRHRYLHLATHGCFQQLGCCLRGQEICEDEERRETDMQPNTLLFADEDYPLADAALLGLPQCCKKAPAIIFDLAV